MQIENHISHLQKGNVVSQMNGRHGSITFHNWWFWEDVRASMDQLPVVAIFRITRIKSC